MWGIYFGREAGGSPWCIRRPLLLYTLGSWHVRLDSCDCVASVWQSFLDVLAVAMTRIVSDDRACLVLWSLLFFCGGPGPCFLMWWMTLGWPTHSPRDTRPSSTPSMSSLPSLQQEFHWESQHFVWSKSVIEAFWTHTERLQISCCNCVLCCYSKLAHIQCFHTVTHSLQSIWNAEMLINAKLHAFGTWIIVFFLSADKTLSFKFLLPANFDYFAHIWPKALSPWHQVCGLWHRSMSATRSSGIHTETSDWCSTRGFHCDRAGDSSPVPNQWGCQTAQQARPRGPQVTVCVAGGYCKGRLQDCLLMYSPNV